jgi:glucuronoarabinoxylan endo-1,4-beta-xylanase
MTIETRVSLGTDDGTLYTEIQEGGIVIGYHAALMRAVTSTSSVGSILRSRRVAAFFIIPFAVYLLSRSVDAQSQGVVVNFTDVHQEIDGFGGADIWASALTDDQADLFFSPSTGIGLSLLRVGIDPNGNDLSAYSNATKAAARGARVWAAPWSAPGAWKDNGTTTDGGHLLPADYDAWANLLTGFASTLQQNAGVSLYGLSVQNEPDWSASYDSMLYTSQEMVDFIAVLGPKLAALNPRPRLIMPEVAQWANAWDFVGAVLGDSTASPFVDLVAVHQYAGVSGPAVSTLPIWMSEMSGPLQDFDPSIGDGLKVAQWIHDAVVTGMVSTWNYFWLVGQGTDNGGLIGYNGNTQMTKRFFTVGNFSKFVRPGFVMVGVDGGTDGVSVSAYENPSTGTFVIVAINQNPFDTPLNVALNGLTAGSVTPWVTSDSFDLAQQSDLAVSDGGFGATLPASSVTSFVGTAIAAPPVITSDLTASGTAESPFAYQITATNAPTSYGATGLPDGLVVDPATGTITGTPTAAGPATVTLSATNDAGTGTAALTVTIALACP